MAVNPIVAILGDKVQNKEKKDVPVASLKKEGGVLGLYFSASWCPPCQGFTPNLADFYVKVKGGANAENFEIVFVSSDKDQKTFDGYYDKMPWLVLPFDLRDKKETLSKMYGVKGIPTLVFLDSNTGEVITKNGRSVVIEDPNGNKFPWTPK